MNEPVILVTGASGFVGNAIATALHAAGARVHGISRTGGVRPTVFFTNRCDLLDPRAVRRLLQQVRPTHLVHAAWDVTHGVYWFSRTNFRWLAASVDLLDAFLDNGGQRAIGIGTCAEYAWNQDFYREASAALAPATPYGRCKLAVCEAFTAAGQMGTSTAWARLFFPYGPGDGGQRFLPSLLSALVAGQPFDTTDGEQLRDFINVEDIGGAIAALTLGNVHGPVNIGTGAGARLKDIALAAAEDLNVDPALLRFGALPTRAGDPVSLIADVSRLEHEVGYRPRIPWRDGIRRTVQAFRDQSTSCV